MDSLTTHEISRLLGVSPGSTVNWIKQGLLPFFRTPGGHRRVLRQDLLQFLAAQKIPIPPALLRQPRLLVVDDDPTTRTLFCRLFEGEEVLVKTADSGVEALIEIGRFDPTVVVLDIRMPGLDGIEVCRRIRRMGLQCAIVLISGFDIEENRRRAFESGADAFQAKPLALLEIKSLLQQFWKDAASGRGYRPAPLEAGRASAQS